MFKLNISKHVSRTTPPAWRKVFTAAWLESLLAPVKTVNDLLLAWVEARRVELTYNGQTIHLERMLNDLFDPQERRIHVVHSTDLRDFDYFYRESQQPDFDYLPIEGTATRFMYSSFEYETLQIDGFRVTIPTVLAAAEDPIRGQILRYRLATIPYELLYI